MNIFTVIAIFTALIICLGIVGEMDAESHAVSERHYIQMVCEGSWPDYRNEKPKCGNGSIR